MATDGLYRPEVVQHRAVSLFGGLMIASGQGSTLMVCGAIVLAGCLILVLVTGTYSRKAYAFGYLTPSAGLVQIVPSQAGLVSSKNVVEGQLVEIGDPLVSISSPRDAASGIDVDQIHVDRLRAERATIESRHKGEQALASERMDVVRQRIADLRKQSSGVGQQRVNALHRAELLRQDVSRLEALGEAGHVSISLLDSRMAEVLEAQQDIQVLDREIDRTDGEIAVLRSELVQIPLQSNIRLDELRSSLLDVERALAEAQAQQSVVVRAPIAGRVTALVAHIGMTVRPERSLLSIVPVDSVLQAELLLPTHAAGFVGEGQEVRLHYDAFPYQKFGLYRGTILSVSRTVLNPEDQVGPVRLQGPAYRVIVELDSQTVTAYGDELHLQPGLTLRAAVIKDRRRIIEWIFDPMIAAARGI